MPRCGQPQLHRGEESLATTMRLKAAGEEWQEAWPKWAMYSHYRLGAMLLEAFLLWSFLTAAASLACAHTLSY